MKSTLDVKETQYPSVAFIGYFWELAADEKYEQILEKEALAKDKLLFLINNLKLTKIEGIVKEEVLTMPRTNKLLSGSTEVFDLVDSKERFSIIGKKDYISFGSDECDQILESIAKATENEQLFFIKMLLVALSNMQENKDLNAPVKRIVITHLLEMCYLIRAVDNKSYSEIISLVAHGYGME